MQINVVPLSRTTSFPVIPRWTFRLKVLPSVQPWMLRVQHSHLRPHRHVALLAFICIRNSHAGKSGNNTAKAQHNCTPWINKITNWMRDDKNEVNKSTSVDFDRRNEMKLNIWRFFIRATTFGCNQSRAENVLKTSVCGERKWKSMELNVLLVPCSAHYIIKWPKFTNEEPRHPFGWTCILHRHTTDKHCSLCHRSAVDKSKCARLFPQLCLHTKTTKSLLFRPFTGSQCWCLGCRMLVALRWCCETKSKESLMTWNYEINSVVDLLSISGRKVEQLVQFTSKSISLRNSDRKGGENATNAERDNGNEKDSLIER